MLACVEQGRWLLEHADAVLDELAGSGLEPADCARVVELVVAQQQAITPHQLRGAVRTAIVLQDLEEAYRRVARVKRDRDVRSWDGKDGGGCALVSGPKPLIAALMASLEALTWPRQPGDTRTASQRRFDALMDLMCGRALPGQWQAQLIATLATAEGDDSQLAEIPGLGTILPSEARALIAQAGLRRVVTDSSGNLITIDPTVVQPDLDPTQDAGPSQRLRTDEREPDPVHTAPGDANEQDLAWLGAQEPRPDTTADTVPPVLDLGEHDVPPTDAELRWLEDQTDRATDYAEQDRQSDRRRRDAARAMPTPDEDPATAVLDAPQPAWSDLGLHKALQRMHTDPVVVTDLSTDAYQIPARLKRHLRLRDVTCTFPGCGRPAAQCEGDHVNPWPRGQTTATNLASECKHHHLAKHAYFTVNRLGDGTIRWTTPGGKSYDRQPRPLLRGW